MELFEEDVWDILDQENNLREIVEVSDEWLEYVTKEFSSIDVKAKDIISAAVCLLSILRITIDLSDYVNTVYIKEQSSGNVLESNFRPIAKNAFKATNKEYLFLHAITYADWKSLVFVKSDGRSRFLSLSIQGRRFLREQLGEIPVLPKIEPDKFEGYNPYDNTDEDANRENVQSITPQPPLTSQAQAFAQGESASVINVPIINVAAPDLSPLADMMRSVMGASRQPIATPSSAPEQPEYPAEEEEQKDDSSPGKRKAGRKPRSQTVIAKEQAIYDGWIRFSESDSGKLRDYAADNGMNEDEMAKLIDRNRPRATRNNSEK